jgi:hypothetical protein
VRCNTTVRCCLEKPLIAPERLQPLFLQLHEIRTEAGANGHLLGGEVVVQFHARRSELRADLEDPVLRIACGQLDEQGTGASSFPSLGPEAAGLQNHRQYVSSPGRVQGGLDLGNRGSGSFWEPKHHDIVLPACSVHALEAVVLGSDDVL